MELSREEERRELLRLCEKYSIKFDPEWHKPYYVLELVVLSNNIDCRETIIYNNYFRKSLFNGNEWL